MRGAAFGLALRPRPRPTGIAPVAPVTAIDADGWSAQWAEAPPPVFAPDTAPQTIAVARAGFDAAARPTVHVDARVFTRRRRLAYPAHADDTPATVALDDYVYATDAIPGVANNSVETSPKPVAAWAMPHRRVVADAIELEAVAFHRNARAGRMVAAVRFLATDGTTTVSQVVAATTLSTRAGDQQPLPVFACTLDVAALAPGLVTVDAEVYPWIGGAASVLRSADQGAARDFSPRYFLKNAALAAAPPLAYVATTGNDATGVVSTTAATAAAAPFASVKGAIDAVHAAHAATTGVDGAIVRIGAGTFVLAGATAARTQRVAALTIERDPAVARGSAIVTWGAAAFAPRLSAGLTAPVATGCLRFRDLTVQRTGSAFLQGETAARLDIHWEDVALDNNAVSGSWLTRSDNWFFGAVIANMAGTTLGAGANGEQRLLRGVATDLADAAWENWVTLACALTRPGNGTVRDPSKGAIAFQNRFLNPNPANSPLTVTAAAAGDTITGFWAVQNLIEVLRATAGPMIRISSDGPVHGHTDHCGLAHNTVTGHGSAGRYNVFYDNNTNGTRRNHRRMWHHGDLASQLNVKGDVDIADAAATGHMAYQHGVGCRGNFTQFRTNSAGLHLESQAYAGARSVIGASATTRNDPGFVDYRAATAAGNGAGGGDYRLLPGGAARGLLREAVLGHDLAGGVRPAGGDHAAGAYT
ncbi:hypothetical protein ASG29_00495 [Sphingomonas sp. Leaf412]|uniref:hypothetical protein n=1 Tax=Sphingomonas sp. Leaf412 TaxID=1736370 RepID=UPI0006FB12B2|nr:hypothetical protein [Sphingomonas sp. Leaf412]KQT34683.1 hypothetical protein ASG29_00495 [Sphingomonas sp. Leaf412]